MKHIYAAGLLLLMLTGSFVRGQSHFTAKFSAEQETHVSAATATGTASCILTDAGLRFYITLEGLSGSINAAHFHNAPMGEDGPVVRTITGDFSGNTATGLWTAGDGEPLTAGMIAELLAGNLYFNVHTSANPAGEIRAQVLPSAGIGLGAQLTPEQEVHDLTSSGSGSASLLLSSAGVAFHLSVDGLSGPVTAAHFHIGAAGTNGPIVRTITSNFSGNSAFGLWTPQDGEPLTPEWVADIIAGNLYFNLHTAANPMGEVRGQIHLSGGWHFTADLDTAQQVHAVNHDANGTAVVTLAEGGVVFELTAEGLSGPITAAHFHNGAAGANGPIVRTITNDFTGNSARGYWTPEDNEPLTPEMIRELIAGNLYFNLHTAANPMGEVRGQVLLTEGAGLGSRLTAAQQVHSVTSDASGSAYCTLTDAGLAFRVTVDGLSGPISAAHFHSGAYGVAGGVVRTITGDFNGNTASGLWTPSDPEPLTPERVRELLSGSLYFNIHTAANPMGEVRGQLLPVAGTELSAKLTPEQEAQASTSTGRGTAALTLSDAGAAFHLTLEGLTGPVTAAHFHRGAAGVNGPIVRTITGDFSGNTASGLWAPGDSEPLTPELLRDLLRGNLYFNIHTAANPAGEVRGQVLLSGGIGMTSRLDAAQEVHVVTSDAMGSSALTLTNAGLVFDLTIDGLSGTMTNAHFHNAPAGVNGPVVRTILNDFSGSTASGVWTSTDPEPLTVAQLQELLAGNIYYNLHTAANPMGEIRGQVEAGDLITGIEVLETGQGVPEGFQLAQNYPNPFNPETTIRFALPRSVRVSLTVYNALGQRVQSLFDKDLAAGSYTVRFEAADLPSGIYFYRLEAGGAGQTRKMLLVR